MRHRPNYREGLIIFPYAEPEVMKGCSLTMIMNPTDILREGQNALFAQPPKLEKAKDLFHRVTLLAPNWVEGYQWLASAWEGLGDYQEAAKAYKEAIRCDAKDPRPKISLGRLLTSMGQLNEAITELQQGLALKPHYGEPDARLFLAEAYEKAHDLIKATEQWEIIEKMDPSYPSNDEPMREARRKLQIYVKH
jgi:tetratricopeptide (TPR) repeat protein